MRHVAGKMVVLGHQGVGKSSLCIRYIEKNHKPQVTPTIGASFFSCKINIEDIQVHLQVWDTAGQERFKSMVPMFYRNANIALLVYDITIPESFESVKFWVQELKRNVEEGIILCVVGNKIDLGDKRKILREEGLQYANSIGALFFETSATENQGTDQVFLNAAMSLIKLVEGSDVSLKIYDDQTNILARSSELNPTDTGRTEEGQIRLRSIAFGSIAGNCC